MKELAGMELRLRAVEESLDHALGALRSHQSILRDLTEAVRIQTDRIRDLDRRLEEQESVRGRFLPKITGN